MNLKLVPFILKGKGISPSMTRNLIIGAMQTQVDYGLKNTTLHQLDEFQNKYNIANRRAIRAIMRAPMYVTNEAIEMELGVRKISDIYNKSVLMQLGKMLLDKNTLHYSLIKKA